MSTTLKNSRRPAVATQWPKPNFVRKPATINPWFFLFVILFFSSLAWSAWHLAQQLEEIDGLTARHTLALQELEKLRHDLKPPVPSQTPQKINAAIAAAHKLEAGMSPAWADFFSGIEAGSTPEITWLGLERDSTQTGIRIEGSATTMDAIFGAVTALASQPRWSGVSLVRVQSAPDQGSFNFELLGQFSPGKPASR